MKRYKVPSGKSKRLFTNTAKSVHPLNGMSSVNPMRGGIRL